MLCKERKYTNYRGHLEITFQHIRYKYKSHKWSHSLIKKEDGSLFSKKCSICETWTTSKNMKKDRNRPHGIASYCKKCCAKNKKQYKEENKEKVRESDKKHREANKEHYSNLAKQWREDNRDHIRKQYEEKREYILQRQSEYYQKNKEKVDERHRDRYYLRKCIINEVSGTKTMKTFYERFGKVCGFTGLPLKIESLEHLLPISKGGGNTWGNLYPVENSLNASKRDFNMFEWMKRRKDVDFSFFLNHTLPYLAEYKGLSVDEYIDWYNEEYAKHLNQISSQKDTPYPNEELPLQEAFSF